MVLVKYTAISTSEIDTNNYILYFLNQRIRHNNKYINTNSRFNMS